MEQTLRTVLESVFEAVLILEPVAWRVQLANRAARAWLRWPEAGELPSANVRELLTPDSRQALERAIESLDPAAGVNRAGARLSIAGGTSPRDWLLQLVEEADGERLLLLVSKLEPRSGTRHFHPAQPFADPADIDELTGLANRRALRQRLGSAANVDEAPVSPVVPPHNAILFVDVDGFKRVNDMYGHAAGDRVLAALARRLAGCVRPTDLVSRYGGDEFVLVLELKSPDEAAAVARRIGAAFAQALVVDGVAHQVPVSVGIALAGSSGSPLDGLIAAADRAMYRAKAQDAGAREGFAFAAPDER